MADFAFFSCSFYPNYLFQMFGINRKEKAAELTENHLKWEKETASAICWCCARTPSFVSSRILSVGDLWEFYAFQMPRIFPQQLQGKLHLHFLGCYTSSPAQHAIKKKQKKLFWWRLDTAAGVFSDSSRVSDRIPLKVKFGDAGVMNGVSLRFVVTPFAADVRWAWSRWVLLMIILAGQNTICQFPVRRGSNFPPDCTLVMTNTADIQTASQLRLGAAVETWSPCCRGGKGDFFSLDFNVKINSINNDDDNNKKAFVISFPSSVQALNNCTDATLGQQVPFCRLLSPPPNPPPPPQCTHHPRSASGWRLGQLTSSVESDFLSSKQADFKEEQKVAFDREAEIIFKIHFRPQRSFFCYFLFYAVKKKRHCGSSDTSLHKFERRLFHWNPRQPCNIYNLWHFKEIRWCIYVKKKKFWNFYPHNYVFSAFEFPQVKRRH